MDGMKMLHPDDLGLFRDSLAVDDPSHTRFQKSDVDG